MRPRVNVSPKRQENGVLCCLEADRNEAGPLTTPMTNGLRVGPRNAKRRVAIDENEGAHLPPPRGTSGQLSCSSRHSASPAELG